MGRGAVLIWGFLKPSLARFSSRLPTAFLLMVASPYILASFLGYLLIKALASQAVSAGAQRFWRAIGLPVIHLGKLTAMAWGYTASAVVSCFHLGGKAFAATGKGLGAAVTVLLAAVFTMGRDLRAAVVLVSKASGLAMAVSLRFAGRGLTIGVLNLAVAAGILVFLPLFLLRLLVDKNYRRGVSERARGLWRVVKARPAVGLLCLGGPILLSLAFLFVAGLIWPSPTTVEVLIWTSAEKQSVLQPALERFNEGDPQVIVDGHRYRVAADSVAVHPGRMYGDLLAGLARGIDFPVSNGGAPTVVSPSTSSLLAQVNLDAGRQVFQMDRLRPMVRTPIVIATYRGMAECLGWPEQPVGWADILDLAESPKGWTACPTARPEWDVRPRVVFPDPAADSTARSTLQLLYLAAAGKPAEQLTVADLDDPRVRDLVRRFQGIAEPSNVKAGELRHGMGLGPGSAHFIPVGESNIPRYYRDLTDAGAATEQQMRKPPIVEPELEVVAIYPEEGTGWHDNPFAIPDAPWVTAEQREAARLVEEFLRGDDGRGSSWSMGSGRASTYPSGTY